MPAAAVPGSGAAAALRRGGGGVRQIAGTNHTSALFKCLDLLRSAVAPVT